MSVDPSLPPTCLKATSPSFVRLGIATEYDSYESDGSIDLSPRVPEEILRIPPRCSGPSPRTETTTDPAEMARPRGRLPSGIVRSAPVATSILVRLAPTSLATQAVSWPTAMSLGLAPVGI